MTRGTVLVVDDSPDNLAILHGVLKPRFGVLAATSGERALRVARTEPKPDLILLDVMMPAVDGYQTLERLRADVRTSRIPVIFVTALTGIDAQLRGLALGAVDFITKPVVPELLLARIEAQLTLAEARVWLEDRNAVLEREVARRMHENDLTQQVTIRALAHLAEARDPETGNHILRTQAYVQQLAKALRDHTGFAQLKDDNYVDSLVRSAPLHDIGKVGIPDHILLKPGKLDAGEWAIMKTHTVIGCAAIERAEQDVDGRIEFLAVAKDVARSHHERWDGGGYPDGLVGDAIPVSARLMAIADVYDALISRRVYKPAMTHEEAVAIIREGRGKHFDPDMTDAFLGIAEEFREIATVFVDTEGAAEEHMAAHTPPEHPRTP